MRQFCARQASSTCSTSRARQRGTSNRRIEWSIVSCIVFKISRALSVNIRLFHSSRLDDLVRKITRNPGYTYARAHMCAAWNKRSIHNSLLGLYITRSRIYTHFTHLRTDHTATHVWCIPARVTMSDRAYRICQIRQSFFKVLYKKYFIWRKERERERERARARARACVCVWDCARECTEDSDKRWKPISRNDGSRGTVSHGEKKHRRDDQRWCISYSGFSESVTFVPKHKWINDCISERGVCSF